jgi:hypothetical protein
MELMLGEIFLDAGILCVILFLVAKHEADYSFAKVAMVTAGIGLGSFLIHIFLFDKIGWLSLLVIFALASVMIKVFCWLSFPKTILVVALFCMFQIGTKFGMNAIAGYLFPEEEQPKLTQLIPSAPVATKVITKTENWGAARKGLILEGSMLNDKKQYVAIVNGEVVEVGDRISYKLGSDTYEWTVSEISKHAIEFKPLGIKAK